LYDFLILQSFTFVVDERCFLIFFCRSFRATKHLNEIIFQYRLLHHQYPRLRYKMDNAAVRADS